MSFHLYIRSDTRSVLSRMISRCALSRYKVRPDDHVEAGRWLVKGPLTDPWMADPAVPVRIEAVPGFAGVWSADRQSRRRPGEPQETGKAASDRLSRIFRAGGQAGGAPVQYVVCYMLFVMRFLLRPSLSQGCEAEDRRLQR